MHTPATLSDAMPLRWAAELVKRMRSLYGVNFDKAWANVQAEDLPTLWAEALAGFTGDEIAQGLIACRDRDWPPMVPEFRRLCRPWTDPEVAFYAAVKGVAARRTGKVGEWPHPAVYWAAVSVGTHDLANCGYSVMRGRWEAALSAQLVRQSWEPIPALAPALPAPGQSVTTREDAEAALKRMGAGQIFNRQVGDPKAWARKILENPRSRSATAINMAKQALGIADEVVA